MGDILHEGVYPATRGRDLFVPVSLQAAMLCALTDAQTQLCALNAGGCSGSGRFAPQRALQAQRRVRAGVRAAAGGKGGVLDNPTTTTPNIEKGCVLLLPGLQQYSMWQHICRASPIQACPAHLIRSGAPAPPFPFSTETGKKKPPIYKVMLHNDNYNRREYVVKILLKTVEGMTVDDAVNVMQEAHETGVALVVACAQETAETYVESLRLNGLISTMEPGH